MKTKIALPILLVGALLSLLFLQCDTSGIASNQEQGLTDLEQGTHEIGVGRTYIVTIGSDSTQVCRLVASNKPRHTISAKSISPPGDLGWSLFDLRYIDDNTMPCETCDDHPDNGDEDKEVTLEPGSTYYLVITERADPGSNVTCLLLVETL